MYGDLMAFKYINTGDPKDIVTIDEIFRRYIQINGTIDGFEEYVNSGFRDGTEVEYEEYVNNELFVSFGSCGYVYFKTKARNLTDAMNVFRKTMENAGVNCDNLLCKSYELRNENGKNID